MVVAEVINGVNDWTGANYTGSTNKTSTDLGPDPNDLPNIYLEELPTPTKNFIDNYAGKINITWIGLYENISEAYYNPPAGTQDWYSQAENILGYSVYRSKDGGEFARVGNATQNRGGDVYFEESGLLSGTYRYKIAVNYRYPANNGTNIIDQNGVTPPNAHLPGIFVSTGRSPASEPITLFDVTSPKIINLKPAEGSFVNTSKPEISAVFVELDSGINETSINLTVAGKNIPSANYTYNPGTKKLSYTPTEDLAEGTCTVTIKVSDLAGNPMSGTWSFTIDLTPPEVLEKAPTGDGVLVTEPIVIIFNEGMDTASVVNAFKITSEAGDPGGWHWEWNPPRIALRGTHDVFANNTTYTCTLNTSAKDRAGNPITEECSWNFTTGPGLGTALKSPYGFVPEDWTGGSNHTVEYVIGLGQPPYTIYFNYTYFNYTTNNRTLPENIRIENRDAPGTYNFTWTLPEIDSDLVKLRVEIIDNLSNMYSDESRYFTIDSTPPTVNWTIPENGSEVVAWERIVIQFSESMDTAISVEDIFSITPDPGG